MLNSELTVAAWKRGFVVVIDSFPGLLSATWSSSSQKIQKNLGSVCLLHHQEKVLRTRKYLLLVFKTLVCSPHFEHGVRFCAHI